MYEDFFEPFQLTPHLTLPNRLVMAPMTTTSGEPSGAFSEQEMAYLALRARSGIGAIMTPACYCHKSGHSFDGQVGAHCDEMLPALKRCAHAIRVAGGKSFLQIHHGGNAAKREFTGQAPWAPSAVAHRRGGSELPVEMTVGQIDEIVDAFAAAAARAQESGFDGIEIHGANTYLFQQFFSPFSNKRDDEYGVQTWESRCLFAIRVVQAVRDRVGPDYPISYRISPEEPDPEGYSTDDAIELLNRIIPLGIDAVHVSSWEYGKGLLPKPYPGGHPTRLIKDALFVPVIGVGMIRTPEQAMRVREDDVELVAMGRQLLFDAHWAEKVRSGRVDELRTQVAAEAEIDLLEVPDKMKVYLRRFYPDNL
jgi:2,4-dienoyl-CoA reductase-like NADH-dependent reductase (Old Yellow Enzyme family)